MKKWGNYSAKKMNSMVPFNPPGGLALQKYRFFLKTPNLFTKFFQSYNLSILHKVGVIIEKQIMIVKC